MQVATFTAKCPFEIGDKVGFVLDKEKQTCTEGDYIIHDILTTHSVRNNKVVFKIILINELGRESAPVAVDELVLK